MLVLVKNITPLADYIILALSQFNFPTWTIHEQENNDREFQGGKGDISTRNVDDSASTSIGRRRRSTSGAFGSSLASKAASSSLLARITHKREDNFPARSFYDEQRTGDFSRDLTGRPDG